MAMQSNNYTHITANGTYVLKNDFGSLEAVLVNKAGSSNNTITVSEGDTNKVIAVIDGTSIHKHDFDLTNLVGIIVTVATGSAGDITVIWQ